MLSIDEIKDLMQALDASGLQKLAVKNGEYSILLEKGGCGTGRPAAKVSGREDEPVQGMEPAQERIVEIKAQMVGTFYRAADPESKPFVKEGSVVAPETVVCVLEAMKLFTEVQAECSGEIVEVLVKDGAFVEYGQPLFRVKV